MRRGFLTIAAAAALIAPAYPAAADDAPTDAEMRDTHAMLLGLSQDGAQPERSEGADTYYSIVDNAKAPRLVTRLEVSPNPCRARATSALQFPGKWATLTLGTVDLSRVSAVAAYASVDDMIAETNAIDFESPDVEQVVLTGRGLYCSSRMSLSGESGASDDGCLDRLDLTMVDEVDKARGRRALAIIAGTCKAPALKRK